MYSQINKTFIKSPKENKIHENVCEARYQIIDLFDHLIEKVARRNI